ncbi:uncharacterized protein LOC135351208 isoform X2 [Halichondria panicea]|uniref:uncharacterized protein LOC135351208 isoform X2 n=1 Tax=Halichondria panicea TaxID=6063 RepID=UPI00312B5EC8
MGQEMVVTPIPATGDTSESQSYSSAESQRLVQGYSSKESVEKLEVVVKKLQEELKKQTDFIQELRQDNHIPATQSDPDPSHPLSTNSHS